MTGKYALATLLLALGAGAVAPASSHAESWAVYRDSIYNCQLEYSTSLFTRDDWDVKDEFQRFSGPDTQTYFRVMGVNNKDNLSPSDVKAKYLKASIPGDIVYERTRSDFLVLSGYRGDSIFYTKVAVSADDATICILEISYPRKAKREMDEAVTRMSRSFAVGD